MKQKDTPQSSRSSRRTLNLKQNKSSSEHQSVDRGAETLVASVGLSPESLNSYPVEAVERIFGYRFKNRLLLEEALTHRSLVDLNSGKRTHYERLEFIGDAVLGLGISKLLYASHPEESEGQLSRLRAAAVRAVSLSQIARKLELGQFIRMSRSEIDTGGREKDSILADIVESILGAIFLDSDFNRVFEVISEIFSGILNKLDSKDPKTDLQELLHTIGLGAPTYQIESTLGPDHAPSFISIVMIGGEVYGRGQGRSKKLAEQSAAEEALRKIRSA